MKLEDVQLPIPNNNIDEKDWDIEKWRKEAKADYLTLARYLMTFSKPAEIDAVFQVIWQAMHLFVPNTLYKYSSLSDNIELNEKKLDTLLNQKVFLAEVKDFNDPFDCKGFFYHPEALSQSAVRKAIGGKAINNYCSAQRVAAFSANGIQSMPMWAHYANNHAGYCVSYDMNDNVNLKLKANTFPVQYTDQRVDITNALESYSNMLISSFEAHVAAGEWTIEITDYSILYLFIMLCNIKHSSWAYEKEFRCSIPTEAPGIPFIDAKPKEIFIGINCKKENAVRLHVIGDTLGIPVHQMAFDEVTEGYQLQIK